MTDDTRQRRVALWCAVSSLAQAAPEKTSLADQEQAGRAFAQAIGAEVVRTYTVPGHTRDILFWHEAESAMPAYRQLREDVERHTFDVLHCLDPDRLGRDAALIHQAISLVERSGAEVYFASSPHQIGQKTSSARYVESLMIVRADEEQAIRVRRAQMGIRRRVQRGLAGARWPYGYDPIRDERGRVTGAEIQPVEAAAVHLVTDRFIHGWTYEAIKDELEVKGYIAPSGGERWHGEIVRRMMQKDIYAGLLHWGAYTVAERSARFPPIWDEPTLAAVRRERAYRLRAHARRVQSPLFGVAYCARCGGPLVRAKRKPTGVHMRCATHCHTRACHWNDITEDKILRAIATQLAQIAGREDLAAHMRAQPDSSALAAQAQGLDRKATDLAAQRQRLALALARGSLDADMYRQSDDLLVADMQAAQVEQNRVQHALDERPDPAQCYAVIERLRQNLPQILREVQPSELNALLRQAGIRVECESGQVCDMYIG